MDISKTCDDEYSCCIITKEEEEEVIVAEDLILEILLRLPPFSVFRFKFVCKSWYSLIFNPDLLFLNNHHHHPQRLLDHHSDDILLISNNMVDKEEDRQHNPHEYVVFPPQNQNDQEQLKVFLEHTLSVLIPQKFSSSSSPPRLIDSCNGLLLYRIGNNQISGDGDETTQYHVLNPITKQCFELPMIDRFGNNFRKGIIYWLHIVFDPSVSLSFKVLICFAHHRHLGPFGIYVYSSLPSSSSELETSSSWKYLTKFVPSNYCFYCHYRAVLLDGFLYLYKTPHMLLCFDVVKDKIWFLSLPPRGKDANYVHFLLCSGEWDLLYFGELGGRLQLIRRYSNDNSYWKRPVTPPSSFYIMEFELEVRHDKPKIRNWTVKYRVDIEVSYQDLAAKIIHIYKTGAGKKKKAEEEDEDEALLLFLNVDRNMVISYSLTNNTFGKKRNFDGSHVFIEFPADWSELDRDLLGLVVRRLSCDDDDYVRIGGVCRSWRLLGDVCQSWRSIATDNRCPLNQFPVLVVPESSQISETQRLLRLNRESSYFEQGDNYDDQLQVPHGHIRRGSAYGWLFLTDDNLDVRLLNPFSGAEIQLPSRGYNPPSSTGPPATSKDMPSSNMPKRRRRNPALIFSALSTGIRPWTLSID